MISMAYVELHARSAFSFLEGASLPEALIARCAELDSPAMALLDRNSLSGAVRFHQQAQKSGVRAIIGAEVAAAEGFRYALLAESRQGYQNLCRLLTADQAAYRAWRSGKRGGDRWKMSPNTRPGWSASPEERRSSSSTVAA